MWPFRFARDHRHTRHRCPVCGNCWTGERRHLRRLCFALVFCRHGSPDFWPDPLGSTRSCLILSRESAVLAFVSLRDTRCIVGTGVNELTGRVRLGWWGRRYSRWRLRNCLLDFLHRRFRFLCGWCRILCRLHYLRGRRRRRRLRDRVRPQYFWNACRISGRRRACLGLHRLRRESR